jgi:hypothetical protein
MTALSARWVWGLLGGMLALASVAACASMEDSPFSAPTTSDGGRRDEGAGDLRPPNAEGAVAADGVVLVHAAEFPSFRLCFEHLPELAPQPDRVAMPQANVVGVEIGSAVRIAPLSVPGKVYVIREERVRSTVGSEGGVPCGERICTPDDTRQTCLRPNLDYQEAGELLEPVGFSGVELLSIAGCGGEAYLEPLGVDPAGCGEGWNPVTGNLASRVLRLVPTSSDGALPVQLVHMSSALETYAGDGTIEVTFGPLANEGPLAQPVASSPPLFEASDPTTLSLEESDDAIYATHGFRITTTGGGKPPLAIDQSLAEVQELSAPRALPNEYYRAASNYALVLLGDPRFARELQGGDAGPTYDPRRAVHLLAVPVIDPDRDAGAPPEGSELPMDGGSGGSP